VHADGVGDKMAVLMANSVSGMNKVSAAIASLPGNTLDFKSWGSLKDPRQLFIEGDQAVHTDIVGNEAWAYYTRTKLQMTLEDALRWAQRYSGGHDDPQDQAAIRRGYSLP